MLYAIDYEQGNVPIAATGLSSEPLPAKRRRNRRSKFSSVLQVMRYRVKNARKIRGI